MSAKAAAAAVSPLWDFPALLKVILLMGINVVVIPVVYGVVIALCNSRAVMREVRTEPWRNAILVAGLLAAYALSFVVDLIGVLSAPVWCIREES